MRMRYLSRFFYAVQLIHQSIVEDGIKVQRADMVLVVLVAEGVSFQHSVQLAAENLVFDGGNEKLQLMPKGHGNGQGLFLLSL